MSGPVQIRYEVHILHADGKVSTARPHFPPGAESFDTRNAADAAAAELLGEEGIRTVMTVEVRRRVLSTLGSPIPAERPKVEKGEPGAAS